MQKLSMATMVAAILGMACGGDRSTSPLVPTSTAQNGAGKTVPDTSGPPATPTPTSNGPVASLVVTPKQVILPQGYYAALTAAARDDKGVLIVRKVSWRSSSSAVVIASDTGVVYAKAVGVATVYATLEGHTDSAVVTVTTAQTPTPTPTPPAVSSFDWTVTISGSVAGPDTSITNPVPGATVTVSRLMGSKGDTLAAPSPVVTKTADANGAARFEALPGGVYHVAITPPAGSPFQSWTSGFGPPTTTEISTGVTLPRKP